MSNPSILDIPDEILVKIFLHLDARERLALGNSCQRFNNLVFGDNELLRNLDFTKEGHRTKESDIQQYFNNENTFKKIRRINIESMQAPESSLNSSICKAINLVELNIQNGLEFKSVEKLSCFLKALVHLKRLSVSWPKSHMLEDYHNNNWKEVLEESFSRLTYLSLQIRWYTDGFLIILQSCQQLEELRVWCTEKVYCSESPKSVKLNNLKFVKLVASESLGRLRGHIMSIVLDPAEWTEFYPHDPYDEVYLERNVEVCAALSQVKEMPLPQYVAYYRGTGLIDRGWPLVLEHLLSEVIRVTHEDVPEKFCCLSWFQDSDSQPPLLEIDEAKKLLKDPGYQISNLNLSHAIEKNCDSHLLASAFPNLTMLVLSWISSKNSMSASETSKPLSRRLRRKGSLASEENSNAKNTDSSFAILIENTPLLKVLEILPRYRLHTKIKLEDWDLDALNLISGWKHLTVIRLYGIPITNGKFLIDIGKECEKLEEIELHHLGPNEKCSWESELLQMLRHCRNLRKLSIRGMSLKHMSEMFGILSNSLRFEHLDLVTTIEEYDSLAMVIAVEKMLRQCQELKKFSTYISPPSTCYQFRLAVESIISELDRPNFQFNPR